MNKLNELKKYAISKRELKTIKGADINACISGCKRGCNYSPTGLYDRIVTCYLECQGYCKKAASLAGDN